ncbi:hypothetical protein [Halopseudomonas sp.]|uniref:hypothetical protein n=1 Tax=Halopseudomonas sp. TaxID=2901191 RepID=UPI0035691FE8
MYQQKIVLVVAYLLAAIFLLAGALVASPVIAANGDIIIGREVQPRHATRKELVPDPNPQLVNPKPNTVIERGLQGFRIGELNDSEFAAVNSGSRLPQQIENQMPRVQQSASDVTRHGGTAGHNPVGHSGTGALSNINGQVNRSVQQGLQPLQILKR